MIYLLFSIGHDRYALESSQVVEVVPRVELWPMPKTPDYVAGLFRYRGKLVPVLDLSQLMQGQPCPERLSTRILLVNWSDANGASRIIGLIVERVTDTLAEEDTSFATTGIHSDAAPYLGDTTTDGQGMIHRLRVDALLPASMGTALMELRDD